MWMMGPFPSCSPGSLRDQSSPRRRRQARADDVLRHARGDELRRMGGPRPGAAATVVARAGRVAAPQGARPGGARRVPRVPRGRRRYSWIRGDLIENYFIIIYPSRVNRGPRRRREGPLPSNEELLPLPGLDPPVVEMDPCGRAPSKGTAKSRNDN